MIQLAPRIVVYERVRFGRPVIEGTRVPVDIHRLGLPRRRARVEETARRLGVALAPAPADCS